jgi:hypothetical protein
VPRTLAFVVELTLVTGLAASFSPVTQPAGWGGKIIELKGGGEWRRNATIIFRLILMAT